MTKKDGSIGDIGCFSFYATKVITTGEGGLVTTKSKKIFEKIQLLRSQAMSIQSLKIVKRKQNGNTMLLIWDITID